MKAYWQYLKKHRQMKTQINFTLALLFIFTLMLLLIAGCSAQKREARERVSIRHILDGTSQGWNTGDLSLYLAPYTPDATEMRRNGPTGGVDSIASSMKRSFWKTGKPLQQLRYDSVEVR